MATAEKICQTATENSTEQCAQDRATSAEERDATDCNSRDGLDIRVLARGRRDGTNPSDQAPPGESTDETGKRIDLNERVLDLDAVVVVEAQRASLISLVGSQVR